MCETRERESLKKKVREKKMRSLKSAMQAMALLVLLMAVSLFEPTRAQTTQVANRCTTSPCSVYDLQYTKQCFPGCTQQSCTDTGSCFEYCLTCATAVVTCYASGNGCSFNSSPRLGHHSYLTTLVLLSSTWLAYLFIFRKA